MTASAITPEVESLKTRLKKIWMAGDYDRFSRYMEGDARDFYERLNVAPGCQLLDVGCGSGQLALIAAKDGLEVTGVDIASNWWSGHGRVPKQKVCEPVSRKPMQRRSPLKTQASTW